MNTIGGKVIAIFTIFVLLFSQVEPAGAAQPSVQPAAGASPAQVKNTTGREVYEKMAKAAMLEPQPVATAVPTTALSLAATPKFVTGPAMVTVSWSITGSVPAGTTLQVTLTDGYVPDAALKYDAASHILTLPVTGASGQFMLNVVNPVSAISFPASLVDGSGNDLADTALFLPKHEAFTVKKAAAANSAQASFSARGGQIKVSFGAGALAEDATVEIGAPAGASIPATTLSGQPFEIDAQGVQSKLDLHQFAGPVSIDVNYSTLNLNGSDENNLYLYWWDPAAKDWAALPTTVDPTTKTLHATTTHFSVFDTGINSWNAAHVPTLDAFQVSQFTGAATYSMPIEVPAGPGGFQPNLSLSYNSQVIDQSTSQTQASWVGMGWSLDMNSIMLDDRGTNPMTDLGYATDDSWSINVNGVSTTIIKNGGGVYQTADEQFMKIQYDTTNDNWTVWDKTGNSYLFSKKIKTVYQKPGNGNSGSTCGYALGTYQWYLKTTTNIFGQQITYNYTDESKNVNVPIWNGSVCTTNTTVSVVTATYPNTITWPNSRYRVRFETASRIDFGSTWPTDSVYRAFQQSRLSGIVVERDQTGDGSFGTARTIRSYVFRYASNIPGNWTTSADGTTHAPVWPGLVASAGGYKLTLLQVQEYGEDGAAALPPTTFSYADGMHLSRADNGYGGKVEFSYLPWSYSAHARLSQTFNTDFMNNGSTCGFGGFSARSASDIVCYNGSASQVRIRGTVINNTWRVNKNEMRPGGFYGFASLGLIENSPPTTRLHYGLFDGTNDTFGVTGQTVIGLPVDATRADALLRATNTSTLTTNNIVLSAVTVELLTSVYRVITRTVSDGQGHSDDYNYSYSGGAVNDDAHLDPDHTCTDASLKATPPTCGMIHEKYSEFRGFSTVAETDPSGLVKTSTFYQTDDLKGRVSSVITRSAPVGLAGTTFSQQITTYNAVSMSMTPLIGSGVTYKDISHNFVTTATDENDIFDNNGRTIGTLTAYTYDTPGAYGNLLLKAESSWNGTGWTLYRKTHTQYWANASGVFLVGFLAHQWVTDAGGATLSETMNIYDNNTVYNAFPTVGILKKVRTWVSGTQYNQVTFGYDTWGNPNSVTTYDNPGAAGADPGGTPHATTTSFTAPDDMTYHTYALSQTNAAGQTTTWTYDRTLGLPLSQSNANGTASVQYDMFGRLTQLTKPGDSTPTLQIVYNDPPQPFSQYQQLYSVDLQQTVDATHNYIMEHTYDGLGREIMTQTGSGSLPSGFVMANSVETTFDYQGQVGVTAQSAPHATGEGIFLTVSRPDILGRPQTVTAPDGSTTSYSYNGLATTVTDANQHATTAFSDVWGRTSLVTPPTGPALSYTYDELGQLKSATRGPSGAYTTSLTYDGAGRRTGMTDPDMGSWSYQYDPQGNLTTQTDARMCVLTLAYDVLNRLTSKTSSGVKCEKQVNESYTYDTYVGPPGPSYTLGSSSSGRRTSMKSVPPDGSTTSSTVWSYDVRGRTTREHKEIGANTYDTYFSYNAADLPVTTTYPDSEGVTGTYNAQMLPYSVSGTSNYVTDTGYDSAGRMTSRSFGNGTQSVFGYYAWNQQGGRLHTLQTGSLQNLSYIYDTAGNIQTITDNLNSQTQSFGYDALDRLTSAAATGGTGGLYNEGYTYDATTGNLASKTVGQGTAQNYSYDPAHVHAVTAVPGNSYTYDQNGNQKTRVINGQSYILSYDAEGRLVSVVTTPLNTPTPTSSPTATMTPTASVTSTATVTATSTVTATATSTSTATVTPTPTITATETATPTQTVPPTDTLTPSETLTPDPATATDTNTPDPAQTASATPTATVTETSTIIATASQTSTTTVTNTSAPAPTNSPTGTMTATATITATQTAANTATPTPAAPFTRADFSYDADGNMVKATMNGVDTYYVNAKYQVSGGVVTKFYDGGPFRVGSALYYTLSDQLGSTSLTVSAAGVKISELRYNAWGQVRYSSGMTQTDKTYTGQRSFMGDASVGSGQGFGLMFYNARWYDPGINHFSQADNIEIKVGSVDALDRFSYVSNNPVNHADPTGHTRVCTYHWDDQQQMMVQDCHEDGNPRWEPKQPKPEDKKLVDVLKLIASGTQDLATTVDFVGSEAEVAEMALGCADGIPAGGAGVVIGCAGGLLVGRAEWVFGGGNTVETVLGFTSLGFTAVADFADDGQFGDDTLTSVTTTAMGTVILDPIGDLVVDGYGSGYNHGLFPGIGAMMTTRMPYTGWPWSLIKP